jgi:lipopolysaccharide export system protein LptA
MPIFTKRRIQMQKVLIVAALLMMSVLPAFADDLTNFLTNYQLSVDGSTAVVATTITYNTQDGPVVVDNSRKKQVITRTPVIRPVKTDSKQKDSDSKRQ